MKPGIVSIIALFLSLTTFAQKAAPPSPEKRTEKFLKRWTKELSLSAEQQGKIKPIAFNMFTRIDKIRGDSTIQNKKAQLATARKEGIANFKAILSADQAALFEKRMQEMKEKKKAKMNDKKSKGDKSKGESHGMKKAAQEEISNDDVF